MSGTRFSPPKKNPTHKEIRKAEASKMSKLQNVKNSVCRVSVPIRKATQCITGKLGKRSKNLFCFVTYAKFISRKAISTSRIATPTHPFRCRQLEASNHHHNPPSPSLRHVRGRKTEGIDSLSFRYLVSKRRASHGNVPTTQTLSWTQWVDKPFQNVEIGRTCSWRAGFYMLTYLLCDVDIFRMLSRPCLSSPLPTEKPLPCFLTLFSLPLPRLRKVIQSN